MKDLWKSGVLILLIIGVVYILYLRECKRPLPCPAEDEMIIKTSVWDSILAVADMKPEIIRDTIFIKGKTIYITTPLPEPVIDSSDKALTTYQDSIVNDEIDVHYDFKVQGKLISRDWSYTPIIKEITIETIKYVPKLVEVPTIVKTAQNGLYGYGVAGGNKAAFLFGGGLDLITKKETMIGYQYQRFGDENFHSIKLGVKIKFRL